MSRRKLLFAGVVVILVLAAVGNVPVMASRVLPQLVLSNQDDTAILHFMTDVQLIDDENGWGVGADALADSSYYGGVKFYRFANDRFELVSQLYADDLNVLWLPKDLEMVNDRGWFTAIDFDSMAASRLIKVESGTLTEVNVRVPPSTLLMAIDLVDADNGWAVGGVYGEYNDATGRHLLSPVILKLENGSWTTIEAPAGEYFLVDVEMLSPNEGWAVGASGDISFGSSVENIESVFLHYRDGSWTIEQRFPQMAAANIEFYDEHSGWAIGGNENDTLAMFRYQDGMWQVAPAAMPSDYYFHISAADLFVNLELTSPDSGFVSSLLPEIEMPDYILINLLRLEGGNNWNGVVFPHNQTEISISNFVAVSPSRKRVIAGMLDSCLSGWCLVTHELADDGTWHELSIYPQN